MLSSIRRYPRRYTFRCTTIRVSSRIIEIVQKFAILLFTQFLSFASTASCTALWRKVDSSGDFATRKEGKRAKQVPNDDSLQAWMVEAVGNRLSPSRARAASKAPSRPEAQQRALTPINSGSGRPQPLRQRVIQAQSAQIQAQSAQISDLMQVRRSKAEQYLPKIPMRTTRRWSLVPVKSTIGPSTSARGLHCWTTSTQSSFVERVSQIPLCVRMLWRKAQLQEARGSTTYSSKASVLSSVVWMLRDKQNSSRWVQRVGMKLFGSSTWNSGYSPEWKQVQYESLC